MVSSDRLRLAKQSISCFIRQSYEPRELVIVAGGSDGYADALESHVGRLGTNSIRIVRANSEGLSLGALRNLSLDHARGALFCQWDDDDLYHPERIRLQFDAIESAGASASFLTDFLFFDQQRCEVFWIDWDAFRSRGPDQHLLPGSVMSKMDRELRYPTLGTGEDNAIREQIVESGSPVSVSGHGYAYVYRFHGGNMYPESHYRSMISLAFRADQLRPHVARLLRALVAIPMRMPYALKSPDGTDVAWFAGRQRGVCS